MSDNANTTTHTISSNLSGGEDRGFDQDSVQKCLQLIENFRKGETHKGDALLEIQSILHAAIAESDSLSQTDFKPAFKHYLELLDHTSHYDELAAEQGRATIEEEARSERLQADVRSESFSKEKELRATLRRRVHSEEAETDGSGDEHEYVLRGKKRRLTPERLQFYPWIQPDQFRHLSNKQAQKLSLECYEEWSEETKYFRGQVTGTPGCPSFPLSQWTLLLEGRAVDLEKVLSGHYSTSIDPKQSQPLGKGFEITLSQPVATHKIKTYGDWSVATDLWVEALTFIMPWKEGELRGYKRYISGFFVDVHHTLHSRIIDFDKACRLKIEGQKYLRFDSIGEFRHLEITHLSSLGMVAYSELQQLPFLSFTGERSSGKGQGAGKKSTRTDTSSRGEPCHNWNRGACDKSTAECLRFHVCSRCRGGHKRSDCPMAKVSK